MRFRLLLCIALAAGLGAFAFIWRSEGEVDVTYGRTVSTGHWDENQEWVVFRVRNGTPHSVLFAGIEEYGHFWLGVPPEEVPSQSTNEVTAMVYIGKRPRSLFVYVAPWTYGEKDEAFERYSRFPALIRKWFARKYDIQQPAYRYEVVLP